jgi:hypothetical protein
MHQQALGRIIFATIYAQVLLSYDKERSTLRCIVANPARGYANSEREPPKSFQIVIDEYITYPRECHL